MDLIIKALREIINNYIANDLPVDKDALLEEIIELIKN